MGAWGVGSLDNDSGLDWLSDFSEFGASAASDVLDACAEGTANGYIDADIGTGVVALAEVVAAALGHPNEDLSDQISDPVETHKDALLDVENIHGRTSEALDGVASNTEQSELFELWDESGELDAWLEQITSLRTRLDAA